MPQTFLKGNLRFKNVILFLALHVAYLKIYRAITRGQYGLISKK